MTLVNQWGRVAALMCAIGLFITGCESNVDFTNGDAETGATTPEPESPLAEDGFSGETTEAICAADGDCDDENPCTDDTCDPSAGCVFTANAEPCEDDNPCTVGDACTDSACTAGTEVLVCDDDNPCTDDSCDAATADGCVFAANIEACDDDNACTLGDACSDSICVAGAEALACDDENDCTDDSCDPSLTDGCVYTANTEPCDDGNPCTVGDACADSACTAGADALICDDGNGCTDDSCDPTNQDGCVHVANVEVCDDNDPCTVGDVCADSACVSGPEANPCDDENPCTNDSCDPTVTDGCVHSNTLDGSGCDDGDLCTKLTACLDGTCVGEPVTCDDQNDCTVDGCDNTQGGCIYLNGPDAKSCDDGDACTEDTTCSSGACGGGEPTVCDNGLFCDGVETCDPSSGCQSGAPPQEDDGVECTVEGCDEDKDEITHTIDHALCDNDLFCDGIETCDLTADCLPGTPPDLDDDVDCTEDACDEDEDATTHTTKDDLCDNDLFCDGVETCDATLGCLPGTAPELDDGVECTADHCDEDTDKITHSVEDSECDNGAFCDGVEICDATQDCQPGTGPELDDGIECTIDACDEDSNTVTHTSDHGLCDNDLFCDGVETCDATLGCLPGTAPDLDDDIECTVDTCDEGVGQIHHEPDHEACDDDDNICTDAICVPATGCVQEPLPAAPCDDDDPCTIEDQCTDTAQCRGASKCVDTDDNPCLSPECVTGGGSAWCETVINVGGACPTGDQCKKNGVCQTGGQCVGVPLCDDQNPCTEDVCDNGICGEATPFTGSPCALNDPCAAASMCSAGECIIATVTNCDDSDVCTADFCDSSQGCLHESSNSGAPCSDDNPCTMGDGCGDTGCASGSDVAFRTVLDDQDAMTVEAVEGWGEARVIAMTAKYQEGFTVRRLNALGNVIDAQVFTPQTQPLMDSFSGIDAHRMVRHPNGGVIITGSAGTPSIGWNGEATSKWRRMVLFLNDQLNLMWLWVHPQTETDWPRNHAAAVVLPGGEIFTAGQCNAPAGYSYSQPCYDLVNATGSTLLASEVIGVASGDNHEGEIVDAVFLDGNTLDGKGAGLMLIGKVRYANAAWQWGYKALVIRLVLADPNGTGQDCSFTTCPLLWDETSGGYIRILQYMNTMPGQGQVPAWDTRAVRGFLHTGSPSLQGVFLLAGEVALHIGSNNMGENKTPWVAHLNGSGEPVWQQIYPVPGVEASITGGALEPGGAGLLLAGEISQSTTNAWYSAELLLRVALDTGDLHWKKAYGTTGSEGFKTLSAMSNGGYVLAGTAEVQSGDPNMPWYTLTGVITRLGEGANACEVVTLDPELGGNF